MTHCHVGWFFFGDKKWKDVVVDHFLYQSEISVLCQGWVRPVVLCLLAGDCSFTHDTGSPFARRRQELEGVGLDNPFPYLSKASALAYCEAKNPKGKS